jgi:hypothetical protein
LQIFRNLIMAKCPDLQELVAAHGGYDRITPAAWRAYDEAVAKFHRDRRIELVGTTNAIAFTMRKEKKRSRRK